MSLSGDEDDMEAGDRDSLAPTPPLVVDLPPPANNGLGPGPYLLVVLQSLTSD